MCMWSSWCSLDPEWRFRAFSLVDCGRLLGKVAMYYSQEIALNCKIIFIYSETSFKKLVCFCDELHLFSLIRRKLGEKMGIEYSYLLNTLYLYEFLQFVGKFYRDSELKTAVCNKLVYSSYHLMSAPYTYITHMQIYYIIKGTRTGKQKYASGFSKSPSPLF